jgi:8-oxo-dGTP pyrophosphatase MutT (NUDIX family)
MTLRSRLAAAEPGSAVAVMDRAPVAKVFGPGVPEQFRRGEEASQMTPASPFSPGAPMGPFDGYDRFPRSYNFETAYNIATRPRSNERVNFETLVSLTRSYDVAGISIWHRIDSIRSLKWKLLSAEHYYGDVTAAVPLGLAALKKPDRKQFFKTWLAKYLWDVLATDSGCLYRIRNRGGRAIGLKVVSGPTIAPLLDYWGDSPDAPAEAYVQYINGLPWGWLTRDDVIYEPFRPQADSPYGTAPIESILLNANTDIRFQVYFLQRFTAGNLPAAFAASPDTWSPEQIEQWQTYWDAMMFGDQSGKHQVKWMPPGTKFAWSNEKDFSDVFSLFLMRKTCAAYHVVPSDLGFTENVNRSSGESQADVQHRVGDLPLMEHIEAIISAFLEDDLGLPLRFEFDRGEEQVDQLAQAQADQAYMDRAVVSPSEIREMRYGLTDATPVPRAYFSQRSGPIPVISLEAVAGPVDPQTAAPEPGATLPHTAFTEAEGVISNPPLIGQPLAEQEYGPSAVPAGSEPVTKEGEGAPSAGITSETGIYGNPLTGADEDEDEDREAAVKSELKAFGNFKKKRRQAGEWHDFDFRRAPKVLAHNLNDDGRLAVRKAAGEVAAAGLAVLAADTGRVLMLQRALYDEDPAAGKLEFPGGHLGNAESPLAAAWREFAEETGVPAPPGVQTGTWTSASGIYQGIVWTVECEAMVPVRGGTVIPNPDMDPDGDSAEAILWMMPGDLSGNPAVRDELLANIDAVLSALGLSEDSQGGCCGAGCCAGGCCAGTAGCTCGPATPSEGDESGCPCGTPVIYDEMNGWQHADGSISHDDGESVSDKMAAISKAADASPKALTLGQGGT